MKKENKGLRKRAVALLLLLSLVVSTGTFAYWASYVEGTNTTSEATVTVGSGDVVETTFDLTNAINSGGLLVPTGQLSNSNEGAVSAIDLSWDVQWLEDEEITQLLGTGTVGDIVVNHTVAIYDDGEALLNAETYSNIYDLINVAYDSENPEELTLDAAASEFAFQLTMDEPADQAEYNLISGATVTITFSYSIATQDITTTDVE